MSTTTKVAPPKRRYEIVRECDHCNGDGEVPVHCDDCGEALFSDTAAEHEDELCLACALQRAQDKIDDAQMAAEVRARRVSRVDQEKKP